MGSWGKQDLESVRHLTANGSDCTYKYYYTINLCSPHIPPGLPCWDMDSAVTGTANMPVLLPFGPLQTMSSSCATCWLIPSESKSRKTVPGLVWSRPAQANVCCCEQIKSNKQLACCLHIPCCEWILVTRHFGFEFIRRLQRPHNDPSAKCEDIMPVYYEVNQTKAAFVRKKKSGASREWHSPWPQARDPDRARQSRLHLSSQASSVFRYAGGCCAESMSKPHRAKLASLETQISFQWFSMI